MVVILQTNCTSNLSNITDCIQAVVSIINLIFVAGVFLYEKHQNRKDAIKEKKEYWYRETLLHRGIDVCENAFDNMENIINRTSSLCKNHDQDESEIKKCISDIQNQIYKIKHVLETYSKIVSSDLHSIIKKQLEELQDSLIVGIAEDYEVRMDCLDRIKYLYEMKFAIFNELYKYDLHA